MTDDELFRKHADELLGFATGLVGPSDAADVVSASFLAALGSRSWQLVANRRAYLYRCVANEAKKLHRTRSRRRRREQATALPEAVEPPDVRPDIVAAIKGLSLRQRAAIFLTYWERMTPAEVGESLGIGEGSVRRHLARARARLREELGDD